jgi:hypothetical protein
VIRRLPAWDGADFLVAMQRDNTTRPFQSPNAIINRQFEVLVEDQGFIVG